MRTDPNRTDHQYPRMSSAAADGNARAPRTVTLWTLIAVALTIATGAVALVAASSSRVQQVTAQSRAPAALSSTRAAGRADPAARYETGRKLLGLAPDGIKGGTATLDSFARLIGRQPDVAEFYQSFAEPFDASLAARIRADDALPFDNWEPFGTTIGDVALGLDNSYLGRFARAVQAFGSPVAISFGHEMNADWYPWGNTSVTPAQFVAAWQRVHDVFAQLGVTNVIWVWVVNIESGGALSPDPDYPGNAYVDWIGVDGYFVDGTPTTFNGLFGPTLADLRTHFNKPLLVVETGANPSPRRPAEIQSIFAAVLSDPGILGFIWFDYNEESTQGNDWVIDDDPGALAVFRSEATDPMFGLPIR
jgi:mannan endo-1,4-beta-mannosidase